MALSVNPGINLYDESIGEDGGFGHFLKHAWMS